jgi:hypothetical protein
MIEEDELLNVKDDMVAKRIEEEFNMSSGERL